MLLQFSVKNFRSFKDEQFITMIPAKVKGHEENIAHVKPGLDVLKSAVIYGANASGKSNFIKGIQALRSIVISSSENKPDFLFKEFEVFKLSKASEKKPIKFTIDFLTKSIRYYYELHIIHDSVIFEKLSFFPKGKKAMLFERKKQDFKFGDYLKGPKKIIEQLTAPNQLLLSKGAVNNLSILIDVYNFFNTELYVSSQISEKTTQFVAYILKSEDLNFAKKAKRVLTVLDTGINDIIIKDNIPEVKVDTLGINEVRRSISRINKFKIETLHSFYENGKKNEILFDIEQESTGTQKLFNLIILALGILEIGSSFIIDEFERSLHPYISQFIIKLFNSPKINKNNAQLIAATHDVTLLSEENKLRRDQIWIVEKNKEGASELFSLADMKGVRDNVPFEKWYLSGRFGGVPNIEDLDLEFNYADEKKESKTSKKN